MREVKSAYLISLSVVPSKAMIDVVVLTPIGAARATVIFAGVTPTVEPAAQFRSVIFLIASSVSPLVLLNTSYVLFSRTALPSMTRLLRIFVVALAVILTFVPSSIVVPPV